MNRNLDEALEDSFPASDPPSFASSTAATAASDVLPASPDDAHKDGRIHVYRVVEDRKSAQAFSGADGAVAGRWTSSVSPAIYASLSPAGAMLEFMAHLEGRTPESLVMAVASLPVEDALVQAALLQDWDQRPYREHVQAIGDAWYAGGKSLALRVPSALCPDECNILINPQHPQFAHLVVVRLHPVTVDSRIRS